MSPALDRARRELERAGYHVVTEDDAQRLRELRQEEALPEWHQAVQGMLRAAVKAWGSESDDLTDGLGLDSEVRTMLETAYDVAHWHYPEPTAHHLVKWCSRCLRVFSHNGEDDRLDVVARWPAEGTEFEAPPQTLTMAPYTPFPEGSVIEAWDTAPGTSRTVVQVRGGDGAVLFEGELLPPDHQADAVQPVRFEFEGEQYEVAFHGEEE